MREGVHYESEYALIVQYTPPLRAARASWWTSSTMTTPPRAEALAIRSWNSSRKRAVRPGGRRPADAVQLRRMRSFVVTDRHGRDHLRDELVNFLHFSLTGESVSLNIPPRPVAGISTRYWVAESCGPAIPLASAICSSAASRSKASRRPATLGILDALDHLPIRYRWSTRTIYLDRHETTRRTPKISPQSGSSRLGDSGRRCSGRKAVPSTKTPCSWQTRRMLPSPTPARRSSAFGYYTPVIVLTDSDRATLNESARLIVRENPARRLHRADRDGQHDAGRHGSGSLPGHTIPNVRRPLIHTGNLADLLPLAGVWTGGEANPCPFYPTGSPPLLHAATTGATPLRVNLHVGDVGHTLIFGPTGAGKSTLLCAISLPGPALRGGHDLRLRQGPEHVGHRERVRRPALRRGERRQ